MASNVGCWLINWNFGTGMVVLMTGVVVNVDVDVVDDDGVGEVGLMGLVGVVGVVEGGIV